MQFSAFRINVVVFICRWNCSDSSPKTTQLLTSLYSSLTWAYVFLQETNVCICNFIVYETFVGEFLQDGAHEPLLNQYLYCACYCACVPTSSNRCSIAAACQEEQLPEPCLLNQLISELSTVVRKSNHRIIQTK